jgi:hypothetical protein
MSRCRLFGQFGHGMLDGFRLFMLVNTWAFVGFNEMHQDLNFTVLGSHCCNGVILPQVQYCHAHNT